MITFTKETNKDINLLNQRQAFQLQRNPAPFIDLVKICEYEDEISILEDCINKIEEQILVLEFKSLENEDSDKQKVTSKAVILNKHNRNKTRLINEINNYKNLIKQEEDRQRNQRFTPNFK